MDGQQYFRITVRPYGASFDCAPDETLLAGAQGCGLFLFSNCQQGECGSCKVRVREGRVKLAPFRITAITLAEIEDDTTLACRSYPRSDLIIAAELTGWPEPRHYPRNP